jgi:tetratricopeptide (TPR) repeat protein
MKKFSFFVAIMLVVNSSFGQSIEDIQKYVLLRQTKPAKEAVDKYLAVEKNAKKPEGWYYKGYVYDLTSKDSAISMTESSGFKNTSFDAMKKYFEMDPKAPLSVEEKNSVLFDLYVGYSSDLGVKSYTAKDYEAAFNYFQKALEVHDFIYAKDLSGADNYKFSALDTTLTIYTAIAANDAKKKDEAAVFYKKLTDANVSDAQYIDAYQYLADYYKTKKDVASFTAIIEKGKKYYPNNNDYWTLMEIDMQTEGVEKPELFDKYDMLMTKYPDNYVLCYNYSVELYRYIYSDEMKTANTSAYKAKLPVVLKKAIAIKSTSEANFLLANFLFNNSIDLSEEARKTTGTKPADVQKKKDLNAASTAAMNEAIPYAEKVVSLFPEIAEPKGSEKVNYRQALSMLRDIYETKKDTAKATMYDDKIKQIK